MRATVFVVALAGIATFPAIAAGQGPIRVDSVAVAPGEGELAAVRHEYAVTASAGDARRLTTLYADDAIAVPREGVILRGAAEIQRYFQQALAAFPEGATVTLKPKHFEANATLASETGTFAESRPGDAAPIATGIYVTIYTRGADGVWRIALEVRTAGRDKQVVPW